MGKALFAVLGYISIHVPHTRDDFRENISGFSYKISIHVPHTRDDDYAKKCFLFVAISIHVPHTRDDVRYFTSTILRNISIHVPHTRDDQIEAFLEKPVPISIHVPHTRDDCLRIIWQCRIDDFNPRPSHEGRLARLLPRCARWGHFNPRPSHEGRREYSYCDECYKEISIHVPHTRDDPALVLQIVP